MTAAEKAMKQASVEAVSIMPTASGDWYVYLFDGNITHFKGAYATKRAAETRAKELRTE